MAGAGLDRNHRKHVINIEVLNHPISIGPPSNGRRDLPSYVPEGIGYHFLDLQPCLPLPGLPRAGTTDLHGTLGPVHAFRWKWHQREEEHMAISFDRRRRMVVVPLPPDGFDQKKQAVSRVQQLSGRGNHTASPLP